MRGGEVSRRGVAVLLAVSLANLVVAALHFGLGAAAPLLRTELSLDSTQLGALLAVPPLGLMLGTFLWGELADRTSERRILTLAFVGFALATAAGGYAARADHTLGFGAALLAAGAFGSAAHSAGGRAISAAFPPHRHGLVLSIRHTAIPIGGAIGGWFLPLLIRGHGIDSALAVGAVLGLGSALVLALVIPSSRTASARRAAAAEALEAGGSPLRVRRLWLLAVGAGFLAFVQLGIGSFLTVNLVDEAGVGIATAAGVFTASQLLAAVGRVALGFWSDRVEQRVHVLLGVGAVTAAFIAIAVASSSSAVEAAMLAGAFVVVTSCNGVVVATAASFAPAGRTGATLGMQTTANAAACTIAPIVLGITLHLGGWPAAELVLLAVLVASFACLLRLRER